MPTNLLPIYLIDSLAAQAKELARLFDEIHALPASPLLSFELKKVSNFDVLLQCLHASNLPAVILFDVDAAQPNSLKALKELKQTREDIVLIALCDYADLGVVLSLFEAGIFEYLLKPLKPALFKQTIRRALQLLQEMTHERLATELLPNSSFGLVGRSETMQYVFRSIAKLRNSRATVLIQGESGTGKERVAQAIHHNSPVAQGEFVAVNTAAIPKDLLESELFGYEKGAFTGATQTKRGLFDQAANGTLFLDEIGDMPLDLQTRLLRVLSSNCYQRVGGTQNISMTARIVAATHQDLPTLVQTGRFREDLYHRLNVICLQVPPLRERRADIPLLADQFLNQQTGTVRQLSADALRMLMAYDFRGNVRELENLCQWLGVMTTGRVIDVLDLPSHLRYSHQESATSAQSGWQSELQSWVLKQLHAQQPDIMSTLLRQVEHLVLTTALEATQGRRAEAAKRLGIGRNTMTRKLGEISDGHL